MVLVSTINSVKGNVSCETSDGSMININFYQRSALDCLLDTIRLYQTKEKSPTEAKLASGTAHGASLGFGVSLISVGCICIMLAVIFSVVHPNLGIYFLGMNYWVGSLFTASGVLNVVSYRYPKLCWEVIAFIGLVVSFGVSIPGMVFAANDHKDWYDDTATLCDNLRYGRGTYDTYGYRVTNPPRDYGYDWDLERCKMTLQQYQSMLNGLVIMTLLLMIWGFCVSLIGLGCRLKALCCGCTCELYKMVPVSTINTENGKVSCATPDGTVINININQRSALDCLLDTIRALQIKAKSPEETKLTTGTANGTSLWLGATFISLGCVCVMLAVIICVVQPSLQIYYTGTHFWVGFPFIVSGALSIVSYRYPKACWDVIAFIGLLACLAVSIAGMVFAVGDTIYHYDVMYSVCDNLRYGRNNYGSYDYRATRPPRDYSYDWDLDNCKRGQQQLQRLLSGLAIMTLLLTIWSLCISLFGLGCRLKALCCGCKCEKPDEEKDDALLSADPTADILTV